MLMAAYMDGLAKTREGESRKHERTAVRDERQRDADDRGGLDGHGDIDEGVCGKDGSGTESETHAHFIRRENGGAA